MSNQPMRFEELIPDRFRKKGYQVKTVGQLRERLAELPADLPLLGFGGDIGCFVGVSRTAGCGKPDWLACLIDRLSECEMDDE